MPKKNIQLTKQGYDDNKKYILLKSKYTAIAFAVTVGVIVVLSIIFPGHSILTLIGIYVLPVILLIMGKRIEKYKQAAE